MQLRGIQDFVPFILLLRQRRVYFRITSQRDDSVMVTISFYGLRIEVDFFDDHIEYSYFEGSEDVEDDVAGLIRTIMTRSDD